MTRKEITQLSYEIVDLAIKVHKELGPGLLENIYEECLKYELESEGYRVKQQPEIKVIYDNLEFDTRLRADLFIDDCIVVELKAVEEILSIHKAQLITYMKLLRAPQGLLINFNCTSITRSLVPLVNEYFNQLP